MRSRRTLPLLLAAAILAAACSSSKVPAKTPTGSAPTKGDLAVEVASYELLSATPQRFLVGIFSAANGTLSYGTVEMRFSYLGTSSSPVDAEPGEATTASFVLVPSDDTGQPPATDDELHAAVAQSPELTQPDQVRGVYEANDVVFDKAGYWKADVTVNLDGMTQSASASFAVVDTPVYPAPGEAAPRTANAVIGERGVEPVEVDSRATGGWSSVPDKNLHSISVNDAIDLGLPVVVVVSTPLYCQSRFCGPVTDDVEILAKEYGGRAAFVHLEVWKDYQKRVINKAAAQWVYHNGDATEPWVFLIGADGKMIDRWQNVLDRPQLEAELQALPKAHTDI